MNNIKMILTLQDPQLSRQFLRSKLIVTDSSFWETRFKIEFAIIIRLLWYNWSLGKCLIHLKTDFVWKFNFGQQSDIFGFGVYLCYSEDLIKEHLATSIASNRYQILIIFYFHFYVLTIEQIKLEKKKILFMFMFIFIFIYFFLK